MNTNKKNPTFVITILSFKNFCLRILIILYIAIDIMLRITFNSIKQNYFIVPTYRWLL